MKETFVYKQKMSYSYFFPVLAFIAIAGACWYFEYGIALRNLRLLAYPNSVYVTAAIAVFFLVSALRKMGKARQSAQNPNPIVVEENGFRFPYKDGTAEVAYAEIENLKTDQDEEEGTSFVVVVSGKRYEFFEENFEGKDKFTAFVSLIHAAHTK